MFNDFISFFIIFIKIFKLPFKEGYIACKGVLVKFKAYQGAVSFYGPWKRAGGLKDEMEEGDAAMPVQLLGVKYKGLLHHVCIA